jgi:hypothetical protein
VHVLLFVPLFLFVVQFSFVLFSSSQEYPSKDFYGQFKTRFLFREMLFQMSVLRKPLESALDHMERQTSRLFNRSLQSSNAHQNVEPQLHQQQPQQQQQTHQSSSSGLQKGISKYRCFFIYLFVVFCVFQNF